MEVIIKYALLTYVISFSVRKVTWLTQKLKVPTFLPELVSISCISTDANGIQSRNHPKVHGMT